MFLYKITDLFYGMNWFCYWILLDLNQLKYNSKFFIRVTYLVQKKSAGGLRADTFLTGLHVTIMV